MDQTSEAKVTQASPGWRTGLSSHPAPGFPQPLLAPPHSLRHEGGSSPTQLGVVRVRGLRSQQHKEKAHGDRQLHCIFQLHGLLQPHKS